MGSDKGLPQILKGIIQYHSSHDRLSRVVKDAWEAVGADELLVLVREMPARCEAVIDAQGGYTKNKRIESCQSYEIRRREACRATLGRGSPHSRVRHTPLL